MNLLYSNKVFLVCYNASYVETKEKTYSASLKYHIIKCNCCIVLMLHHKHCLYAPL